MGYRFIKKAGMALALMAICVIGAHACVHFEGSGHQDNQDNCCLCHTVLSPGAAPVIAPLTVESLAIFRQENNIFVFKVVTCNESSRSPPSI